MLVYHRRLVGIDVSHRNPDILDLCGMVEKLLTGRLFVTGPVSTRPLSVVNPSPLDTVGRCVLNKSGCLGTAAVIPDRLDILVFCEVLGQVVAVAGDYVNNPAGYIGRVKYLHTSSHLH